MPNVTINLAYLMGSPVAGAYVSAKLITPDVLTDLVIPKRHLVYGYTDESGALVLSLAANEGAPVYSYYRVRAWHPLTRQKVLDIAAFIPSTDCGLHETRYLRYPPNVDLRTLPEPYVPTPFPSEDTPYIATLSEFMFATYQQGATTLAVADFIGGSLAGLGLPYAHAEPPGSSVYMAWVPGMPETMVEMNPSENTWVSYECNAYGEQTDLNDTEIAFLNQGDGSGVARSHAMFRKITYNPASDECIEIVDVGDFSIRDLPSFDAWIADAISGEVMGFRLYPSFAIGEEVGGPACFEAMGRIICRAYPL